MPPLPTLTDILLALCLLFQGFALIRLAQAVHRLRRQLERRERGAPDADRPTKYATFEAGPPQ